MAEFLFKPKVRDVFNVSSTGNGSAIFVGNNAGSNIVYSSTIKVDYEPEKFSSECKSCGAKYSGKDKCEYCETYF